MYEGHAGMDEPFILHSVPFIRRPFRLGIRPEVVGHAQTGPFIPGRVSLLREDEVGLKPCPVLSKGRACPPVRRSAVLPTPVAQRSRLARESAQ